MLLHIGVDDTDSTHGMCTTYLGYKIALGLARRGGIFADYPRLVRLNPNVPWRTRGNGAVSISIHVDDINDTIQYVIGIVDSYADTAHDANPGVVFVEGAIPDMVRQLASDALYDIISIPYARGIAESEQIRTHTAGSGRGIIGAMASIGYEFGDATAELLTYRREEMWGRERHVDADSVCVMQEATWPHTFGSYDYRGERPLVLPHGPDPVFYGIRGESPQILCMAAGMVSCGEVLEGHIIYRTNQGTGDHLRYKLDPRHLVPYQSGMIHGKVHGRPRMGRGGHAYFDVSCEGVIVQCALYRPTGLASVGASLLDGDIITVGGGVRPASSAHGITLNVEYISIKDAVQYRTWHNPHCTTCNKNMKSQGRGQGYACVRCGITATTPQCVMHDRAFDIGEYLPRPGAQRHLTRPPHRGSRRNHFGFEDSLPWLLVY